MKARGLAKLMKVSLPTHFPFEDSIVWADTRFKSSLSGRIVWLNKCIRGIRTPKTRTIEQ